MNKRINKIIAILLSIAIVFANQTVAYGRIVQQDNEELLEGYENLNIDEDLDISKFATPSIASFRMVSLLNTGGGFSRRTTALNMEIFIIITGHIILLHIIKI